MRRAMRARRRLVTVVLAAAACAAGCGGHHGTVHGPTPITDAGPPPLAKRVDLAWASEPVSRDDPSHAAVYLAATDETGKTTSYPLGTVAGTCARIPPVAPDLLTYECKAPDGAAVRFHAILQVSVVVVMKEDLAAGASSDPMNGEELTRISLPLGAKIEAGG